MLVHPVGVLLAALVLTAWAGVTASQIEFDDDITRLFAHDRGKPSRAARWRRFLLEVGRKVDRIAKSVFADHGVRAHTTGVPVVASEGTNLLARELLTGLLMTVCVIVLCIGIAFRSPAMAVASLVPNLLPVAAAAAFFGATGRYIDPVPAISFTIAISIAVDDTLHLFARYAQGLREGMPPELATRTAVGKTYRPVAITTAALVAGFTLLLASGFPPNRSLGVLVAATLAIALVADFFLTPAWLAWLQPQRSAYPAPAIPPSPAAR